MICSLCLSTQISEGSDPPQCAFTNGVFRSENWNCATINLLRSRAENRQQWSDNQNAALLAWEGRFILLSWYKRRGRTEGAWLLDGEKIEPLTLIAVEEFIAGPK